MPSELHLQAQVLPGNKIEIHHPELSVGETVEVSVLLPEKYSSKRSSVLEIIERIHSQRSSSTSAAEIDRYLEEERNSWDS